MEQYQQDRYYRNRNFITWIFSSYLKLVVVLVVAALLALPVLGIVLHLVGAIGPHQPAGLSTTGIWTECEQLPSKSELYKSCMVDPQDGRKPFRNIVPMTDSTWAELQDNEPSN